MGWLVDMEFGLPTIIGHLILFQNEHSPCGLERCSVEGVEIDAAGNRFADVVPAVPIGGGFSGQIATRFLHSEIQLPHQLSPDVVDAKGYGRIGR